MKILKEAKVISEEIVEEENEGLLALMGQEVTFFCAIYIYAGKLIGVNKTCVKLENPKIVYETGEFSDKNWKDAQSLPNEFYLQIAMIEGFGKVK
jgi:hypothetical protein